MNPVYQRSAHTASRMIARYGVNAMLARTHADDGTVTGLATRVVEMGVVKHALADSGVQIGDMRLLADRAVSPAPGDRIDLRGESRVIVDPVIPIRPGDTVVAFECYARIG